MKQDKEKFDHIRKLMEKSGFDGLLLKIPENVLYFSNWWPITGWGVVFFNLDEEPILLTPSTESLFAENRIINYMIEYEPKDNNSIIDQFQKLEIANKSLKIGIEKNFESIAGTHLGYEINIPNDPFFYLIAKNFKNWKLEDATELIYEIRAYKSKLDFENLKLVNELNYFGLQKAAEAVYEEKTEIEIATICESTIQNKLLDYNDKIYFIRALAYVMAGPENGSRACFPYNISSSYKMKKGELCMLELNTQVNGYWSDITRTWVVGRNPSIEQQDMINTINQAIEEVLKNCKPHEKTQNIYQIAKESITKTKWRKYFTPFLGHGIGVKLHEPIPMFYPNSTGKVDIGHYFTVEPGLYGKEILGGLRIERNVFLSDSGPIFTDLFPCEL